MDRGFQLACFVFPERPAAVRILTAAMDKLKAQRGRESRRTYWRDKHLKRGITRITRDEGDTLQWLILFESDPYEQEQERQGGQSQRDMVVRYIKILVRAGTAMSSFYVNVGIHRLLHNYSTAETQRIYETLTDRYLGADEYRRAKSALMEKLLGRFGQSLITERSARGEIRFAVEDDQARWTGVVEVCLKAFTPWSTMQACPVPPSFIAGHTQLPPQLSGKSGEIDPDKVEINRCHALIDPICHGRLVKALTSEPPQQKLAVPRFNMENARQDHDSTSGPAGLTQQERQSIEKSLSQQASRREKAKPDSARIVVDGVERARVSLTLSSQRSFVIQEGTELIELWTESDGEDLLLAVLPVAYTAEHGIAPEQTVLYRNRGRRLELAIAPDPAIGESHGRASVTLESRPGLAVGWLPKGGVVSPWRWTAGHVLAAALFLALGWLIGGRLHQERPVSSPPSGVAGLSPQPAPTQMAQTHTPAAPAQIHRLVPDELLIRSGQGPQTPVIALPKEPSLIALELPVSAEYSRRTFRALMKRFAGRREVLSESMLAARIAGSSWLVDFPVPSRLLRVNEDYTVDLQIHGAGGTWEDVSSYTFHTK
ncbi:MAG TPA: hypothetical protein VF532_08660 [Candidatus Angelobacter sp.]